MSCHPITSRVMLSCLVSLSLCLSVADIVVSSFDQPNFELVYCEGSIRLVSEHVLTTFIWDFITRSICK
jgi:hypothetical protein